MHLSWAHTHSLYWWLMNWFLSDVFMSTNMANGGGCFRRDVHTWRELRRLWLAGFLPPIRVFVHPPALLLSLQILSQSVGSPPWFLFRDHFTCLMFPSAGEYAHEPTRLNMDVGFLVLFITPANFIHFLHWTLYNIVHSFFLLFFCIESHIFSQSSLPLLTGGKSCIDWVHCDVCVWSWECLATSCLESVTTFRSRMNCSLDQSKTRVENKNKKKL